MTASQPPDPAVEAAAFALHAAVVYPPGEDHSEHWAAYHGTYREQAAAAVAAALPLLTPEDVPHIERQVREGYHVPTIAHRRDGSWGVICQACSDAAGDYVFPCKAHPDDWSRMQYPPILVARGGSS